MSLVSDNWWNDSIDEVGVQAMDRTLAADASWDEVLQSGREELAAVKAAAQLKTGLRRRLLDVGCGVGRVSYALAEEFGEIVGVDVSPALIAVAQAHNDRPSVRFLTVAGSPLLPEESAGFDTVFANEVFYYLAWSALTDYSRDAFRLLRSGGEYAFLLNMEPIRWTTRCSWLLRAALYRCSIHKWRGWSNSPGFTRHYHPADRVRAMLAEIGFEDIQVRVGKSIRQTWFVAGKP